MAAREVKACGSCGKMGPWVRVRSEPGLWTVGFYKPDGTWEAESDHAIPENAAKRVHYLNGGPEEAA